MKRIFFIIAILIGMQSANCTMYECTYKNNQKVIVTSSFNSLIKDKPNYQKLSLALKSGNCKELIVKKYFLEGTSCNIQLYKHNKTVCNLACAGNNQKAMKKLKAIAIKQYGYFGKL